MPFGAAWWVGPCARTALLGGGAVPPQGRPLRGRGPAWGFLCHPGGLCRGPRNFCGRRGLVAQETAPLGHQGAPAKSPFCQAWGVGCQCTRCVATAGAQTSGAQPLPPRWLTLARVAPRRWPVGGCTGACDSGCWLGCRLGQVGFGWLTQGAWQGAAGVHWPAMVGKCKPPRWHQTPGIFSGPSWLPVVAETAAQTTQLCGTRAANWPWACVCQNQAPSV